MALQKAKSLNDGRQIDYWRIIFLQLNLLEKSGRAESAGYKDRTTRLERPRKGIIERGPTLSLSKEDINGLILDYTRALPQALTWDYILSRPHIQEEYPALGALYDADAEAASTLNAMEIDSVSEPTPQGFSVSHWAISKIALSWAGGSGSVTFRGYIDKNKRLDDPQNYLVEELVPYSTPFFNSVFEADSTEGADPLASLESEAGFSRETIYDLYKNRTEFFTDATNA